MENQSFCIKQLSNERLLSQTKLLVQKERELHIQVLHHLSEIDTRKLFFKQGFSSLFDYAVRELGYSEGAAYRRIKAMKLCRNLPKTASRLQSGSLSLSAASQLQVFFEKQDKKMREEVKKQASLKSLDQEEFKGKGNSEEKTLKEEEIKKKEGELQEEKLLKIKQNSQNEETGKKPTSPHFLSLEEKESLVKKVEGCSTRATEKLLSEADPSLSVSKREHVRFLGKGKVEIKIVIEERHYKELEELKSLLSHRNPALSYGELLSLLSEEALKKYDPRRRNIRKRKVQTKEQKINSLPSEAKATLMPKLGRKTEFVKQSEDLLEQTSTSKSLKQKNKALIKKVTSAPKLRQNIKKISRTVSPCLRKYIWKRDGGQCTYVHHKTKRRCVSRHLLQIDHIQPFALGGKTVKENLRLLCAGHNQYRR